MCVDKIRRLKICIIGETGNGKSSLGNVLLGFQHDGESGFPTSDDDRSCTDDVHAIDGNWMGDVSKPIRIIDTPGFGDPECCYEEYRKAMVEALEREGEVDAFVWVKNAQKPRFDKQDVENFKIMMEIYGGALFHNLVIVLSRWSYSETDERRRQRSQNPVTLKSVKEILWNGFVGCTSDIEMEKPLPIMAIDALHDEDDDSEKKAFVEEINLLWETFIEFRKMPVKNIHMIRTRISELETLMKEHPEQASEIDAEIMKEIERVRGPKWSKGLAWTAGILVAISALPFVAVGSALVGVGAIGYAGYSIAKGVKDAIEPCESETKM